MTGPLTFLFAVASGAAVGSLYYAQPLLHLIATDLHVGETTVGLLVTATQIGYALGILFIVPLGDFRDRRRLVPLMMVLAAAALVACAVAPGITTLALALGAVGVTSVSGQILTPLAGDLSTDEDRGRIVGVVVSGLVTGILVARVFSGVVAGIGGWRIVFLAAAAIVVVLAVLLHRSIPRLEPRPAESYQAVLKSVFTLVLRERTLRATMVLGALGFAVFTMFWTALTFLLSTPPYSYPTSVIGLFAVAGLVGAAAAQGAGRVHDRGWNVVGTGVAWLLVLAAWVLVGFGGHVLVLVVVGIVVLDIGIQGQHILNQSRLFQLVPHARSRVNTAYVAGNFVGGALGSIVASTLWAAGGWAAVSAAGAALSAVALAWWLLTRRGALTVRAEPAVL